MIRNALNAAPIQRDLVEFPLQFHGALRDIAGPVNNQADYRPFGLYQRSLRSQMKEDDTAALRHFDRFFIHRPQHRNGRNAGTFQATHNPRKRHFGIKAAQFIDRVPKDPWDNDYQFTCDGTAIEVISPGPDGEFDSPDDISSKGDAEGDKDADK